MEDLENLNKLQCVLKVLADKNRLRILKLLEKRQMCVCQLAYILGIAQPSVSRHLKKLKNSGLLGEEQDSFWTNYYLRLPKDKYIRKLVKGLQHWLNQDSVIRHDLKKAKGAKRSHTCVKKQVVKRKTFKS